MSDFVNITRNNNDIISTYTNNQNDEGGDKGIAGLAAQLADMSYSVKSYGAKGDWNGTTGTDDTTAIRNAIAACQGIPNATLKFPKAQGYCVSDTINIPAGIHVMMDAPIVYIGISNIPALIIGSDNVNNLNVTLKLSAIRQIQSDWTDENCIGIKIFNANTSDIIIQQADNFTLGVQCIGSGRGFAYNEIKLFELMRNKYAFDGTNENSGWFNENHIYGGRYAGSTGVNNGLSRYGVRINSKDGSYPNNNNNIFHKPSFELLNPTSGEALPILIVYGQNNRFLYCRTEGNGVTLMRVQNGGFDNIAIPSYVGGGSGTGVDQQGTYRDNFVLYQQAINSPSLYNFRNLHLKANAYDTTKVYVPGVHVNWSGLMKKAETGINLNANYLELNSTRGLGIYVDTTQFKRFVINRDCEPGYGGRISIQCFDVNGTLLTDPGNTLNYVRATSGRTLTFNSDYNGYKTGSDSNIPIFFVVDPIVCKIVVTFIQGTAVLRIRGFSIISLDGECNVYSGVEEVYPGLSLAIQAPTFGTYNKGKVIKQDVPVVGSPKGWVCTVAGTPGTWVSEGNL